MMKIKIKNVARRAAGFLIVILLLIIIARPVHADNPITRGTPLQMTNIILNLARQVGGVNFGSGMVTQLNTGYGLVGGPITNGGSISVNSNVIGTVIRVDSANGILGGGFTRSGTLHLDTNNFVPWIEAGTNIAVVRSGRTNTVHGTIYGLYKTNIFWQVVSNLTQAIYYGEFVDEIDTNGVVLSYTPPVAGFYRVEYATLFHLTNSTPLPFDGRLIVGVKYGNVGATLGQELFDAPSSSTTGIGHTGGDGTGAVTTFGGVYFLYAGVGQPIQLTNHVVVSWSEGDYSGWAYFNATLSTVRTNIFLGL